MPRNPLPALDQMDREHRAWGNVVLELRALDLEMQHARLNRLVGALHRWGEELAALRIEQYRNGDPVREWADEKRKAFPDLAVNDGGTWRYLTNG